MIVRKTTTAALAWLSWLWAGAQTSPKYEFRAAWIASVDHIDWPSEGAVGNVALQKQEFIDLLDLDQKEGLNAVIVQIRPVADAFYPSPYEPWSAWLTGKQGQPPNPWYDPLAFMISETHKRGMEFHAWINPYRAIYNIRKDVIAPTHITRLHPEWFVDYGGTAYFNPGEPAVWDYLGRVIRYIVHNYDIDAIHFDDYFYPYPESGVFDDLACYERNNRGLGLDDWRRSNVDTIICRISRIIKEEKPYCKFGISPYAVWRTRARDPVDGTDIHAHLTDYDDLYADILLWLRKGWIDYVAPQLYFERSHRVVPYETMLDWWRDHTYGRQLYIGIGLYKAGTNPAWRDPDELPAQVRLARENAQGCIFFSNANLARNPLGWSDSLEYHYYRYPALIPPMAWIDQTVPAAPEATGSQDGDSTRYALQAADSLPLRVFVVYHFPDRGPTPLDPEHIYAILPAYGQTCDVTLPKAGRWLVTAVSRGNVESTNFTVLHP